MFILFKLIELCMRIFLWARMYIHEYAVPTVNDISDSSATNPLVGCLNLAPLTIASLAVGLDC